jgi:hypothetical protein
MPSFNLFTATNSPTAYLITEWQTGAIVKAGSHLAVAVKTADVIWRPVT